MQLTYSEQHVQGSLAHVHQMTAHEAHAQALNSGQIQPAGSTCMLVKGLTAVILTTQDAVVLLILPVQMNHTWYATQHKSDVNSDADW